MVKTPVVVLPLEVQFVLIIVELVVLQQVPSAVTLESPAAVMFAPKVAVVWAMFAAVGVVRVGAALKVEVIISSKVAVGSS